MLIIIFFFFFLLCLHIHHFLFSLWYFLFLFYFTCLINMSAEFSSLLFQSNVTIHFIFVCCFLLGNVFFRIWEMFYSFHLFLLLCLALTSGISGLSVLFRLSGRQSLFPQTHYLFALFRFWLCFHFLVIFSHFSLLVIFHFLAVIIIPLDSLPIYFISIKIIFFTIRHFFIFHITSMRGFFYTYLALLFCFTPFLRSSFFFYFVFISIPLPSS